MTIPEQPAYTGVPDLSRLLTVGPWPVAPSQQKGSGGASPSFPVPNSPGLIPSVYLDALHPKFPMMVLQTAVARGDGVTTVFTVTGGYEAGFLEVFINGLKQRKTTNWTETSASAGTFTMLQAPKTNDYIDVIYGKLATGAYCGLEFCDAHTAPAFSGTVVASGPALPTGNPFSPMGSGKRTVIVGLNTVTQNVFAAFTNNIYAVSPTYVDSSTGFPTPGDGSYDLLMLSLDPFDTKIAYAVLDGPNGNELWKNTTFFTGGSWAKIYDKTTHNTLTGEAETTIDICGRYSSADRPGDIVTTVTAAGYLGFVAVGAGGLYFIKTINRGTSFTATALIATATEASIQWSQHDATRIYIYLRAGGDSGVYKSIDGGTTFSLLAGTDFGGGSSGAIYHPYGAASDTTDMLIWYTSSVAAAKKSSDSGAIWATLVTPFVFNRSGSWELTTLSSGIGYGSRSNGSTDKYLSSNGGVSWTLSGNGTRSIVHMALLLPAYGFGCDGDNGNEVFTSADWQTFTTRIGNLHTIEGANPNVNAIVPDWSYPD